MNKTDSSLSAIAAAVGVGVVIAGFIFYIATRKRKEKRLLNASAGPDKSYFLELIEKENVSHDTRRFRFALPDNNHALGLPIGQHISIYTKVEDDLVIRSYTPISSDDDKGYVDLLIKIYFKNVHPKFPQGGKMTCYLENLKVGDKIEIRGPNGRIQYKGHGVFTVRRMRSSPPTVYTAKKISMIAGGTGITPMLQLIRQIAKDPTDDTQVRLLFANQTEKDILLRKELDDVAAQYPDKFKVWYTVDTPPDNWKYSSGFINEQMLREHIFPPSDDHFIVMCGPPPMLNHACIPNLEKIGHKKELWQAY